MGYYLNEYEQKNQQLYNAVLVVEVLDDRRILHITADDQQTSELGQKIAIVGPTGTGNLIQDA
jgi:hypothetical protein